MTDLAALPDETMKAGRSLDALIAEKVFGKRTRKVRYVEGYTYEKGHLLDSEHQTVIFGEALAEEMDDGEVLYGAYGCDGAFIKAKLVPHYSTGISDAWKVIEKLAPHYIQQAFSRNEIGHWEIDWCVSEESYRAGYRTVVDYSSDYETDSLPLAICLAALRSVASRVPENKEGKCQ